MQLLPHPTDITAHDTGRSQLYVNAGLYDIQCMAVCSSVCWRGNRVLFVSLQEKAYV